MDKFVRRVLLKPLVRRRRGALTRNVLDGALAQIDDRAIGEFLVTELRDAIDAGRSPQDRPKWDDPQWIRHRAGFAQALYRSRRISLQEYVFYAAQHVEAINDKEISVGATRAELAPIEQAMNTLRIQHGLLEGETWVAGTGPPEFWRLSKRWSEIVDKAS